IDAQWNGLLEATKMAAMADAYEVNVASHNFNGPLANIVSAHFCAAIHNFRIMEFDADEVPWKAKLLTKPYVIENGEFLLPPGPGWGTAVNEAIIRAGACDTFCEPPRRVTMAAKERQARGTYPVCFAFFHSCRRASERGSCGYPKLFLLLRFLSAARRRRRPRPRSSRCRRALFCARIAASTRLDGVTAASFGAGAATVSAAAIPMVPAQAARREV